ncbi:hypothetical protein TanjilG_01029 [Lupinus angustifolius]|uniref:Uncharacterized protein n=1 Tax=Lupinus angustifolius TaxID=3871 RepID=A0A4P1QR71_LUPAN|nr:PREDICTED: uncharacterized protein LOC109332351 isoform X1 [Lupinus angustifolius]XP_019422851.1 PREDICTED: uncharacterized protein LOC109332351 isoform X2 [Lupinus angustifolius]OIV92895.1 hypothetical protein TanjilG_01029 [Lupinus angustifolius]
MSDREDNDSDAPEEFTAQQGVQLDEEIQKIQRENKARVVREGKERRRQWAQKLTPRPSKAVKNSRDVTGTEPQQESNKTAGFLPDNIVQMLAAREKKVFVSDTNEEIDVKKSTTSRKRKSKKTDLEPVILSEIGPPQCLHSALDFLRERKRSVPRSSSVLNNSSRALRLLSSSGVLGRK